MDYLLKPVPFHRFLQACTRAHELLGQKSGSAGQSFFVRDGYEWVRIDLADLLYVEGSDNYLVFVETGRKTTVRMTMAEAAEKLPEAFCRVHKSFILNTSRIDKLEKHQVTICGRTVPVSVTYQPALFARLLAR